MSFSRRDNRYLTVNPSTNASKNSLMSIRNISSDFGYLSYVSSKFPRKSTVIFEKEKFMKRIKLLSLGLILGLAGFAYSARAQESQQAQGAASCCAVVAACCATHESCCTARHP